MSLSTELKSIDSKLEFSLQNGTSKSIKDFYDAVIEKTLPSKQIVLDWNDLLSEYIEQPDAVFAVRAFGSWSDDKAIDRDKQLRRGFLTKASNNQISYFFCDNYFTSIIAKLIYKDICPSMNEFKTLLLAGDFPVRVRHTKDENERAYLPYTSKNPSFGTAGYKIAHIVDSGDDFYINDRKYGLTELSETYNFPRGNYNDWKKDSLGQYVRIMDINNDTKKILKAHFMRFVNPLNYFLAPKDNTSGNIFNYFENPDKKDKKKLEDRIDCRIAEYKPILSYVNEIYTSIYGKVYQDFQTKILLPKDYFQENTGDQIIDINFGMNLFSKKDDLISFLKTGIASANTQPQGSKHAKSSKVKQTTSKKAIPPVSTGKGISRIAKWNKNINLKSYKIVALMKNKFPNGISKQQFIQEVNILFRDNRGLGAVASLMTDRGNSYGKIFYEDPKTGLLTFTPEAQIEVNKYYW